MMLQVETQRQMNINKTKEKKKNSTIRIVDRWTIFENGKFSSDFILPGDGFKLYTESFSSWTEPNSMENGPFFLFAFALSLSLSLCFARFLLFIKYKICMLSKLKGLIWCWHFSIKPNEAAHSTCWRIYSNDIN